MADLYRELKDRGLVYQVTDESLGELLSRESITLYAGFDPSASSLHVGNLLHLVTLARFQRAGHHPIAIAGGATGMIGDPSGKADERKLLDPEQVETNLDNHVRQMRRVLDFEVKDNPARVLNNAEWIGQFSFLEFLRDVGKHFSVPNMLAKESIKSRLATGISFTEFAYVLLQAYDFLHLHQNYGCKLQIGGQDQWGNITAGVDLIRRKSGGAAYGMTSELITTASGTKFGKSEGNAVWLDPDLTSPYQFYQFWIRAEDADVANYLKLFTFIPLEEIEGLAEEVRTNPGARRAQAQLARHMTEMLHGKDAAAQAVAASQALFGSELKDLSDDVVADVFREAPATALPRARLSDGVGLVDLLTESGMLKSRGESRRLIAAGGVYVNNRRVTDVDCKLTEKDLASEHFLLLRTGKKNYHLLRFES